MLIPLPPPKWPSDQTLPDRIRDYISDLVESIQKAQDLLRLQAQRLGTPTQMPTARVAQLLGSTPTYKPVPAGRMVFVTDDATGPRPAYSDGLIWRRVVDDTPVA